MAGQAFVLTSYGVYPDKVDVYRTDGDRPIVVYCPLINVGVHLSEQQAVGLLSSLKERLEGAVT